MTKLAWLREHEPDVFARVAHVLLPHDWLTLQLSGELVTDRGDASGTGYWSPSTGCYVGDVFGSLELDPDVAPTVLEPGGVAGHVATTRSSPPGPATTWVPRSASACAKATSRSRSGTSGTVFAVAGSPTSDASGAVAGFADATGRFLPLVCTLNATKVTDTMARLLGRTRDELEQLALACRAGAGGVVLLPYFDGERTPNLPDATGTLHGLRSDTEPAQLARAAYEGVVCGLLDAFDALRRCGRPDRRRSPASSSVAVRAPSVYPQLIADLLQRPVVVPAPAEYVARGACVQAAAALTGRDVAAVSREWAPPDGQLRRSRSRRRRAAVRAAYRDLLVNALIPNQETEREPHLLQRRLAGPPEGERTSWS